MRLTQSHSSYLRWIAGTVRYTDSSTRHSDNETCTNEKISSTDLQIIFLTVSFRMVTCFLPNGDASIKNQELMFFAHSHPFFRIITATKMEHPKHAEKPPHPRRKCRAIFTRTTTTLTPSCRHSVSQSQNIGNRSNPCDKHNFVSLSLSLP